MHGYNKHTFVNDKVISFIAYKIFRYKMNVESWKPLY